MDCEDENITDEGREVNNQEDEDDSFWGFFGFEDVDFNFELDIEIEEEPEDWINFDFSWFWEEDDKPEEEEQKNFDSFDSSWLGEGKTWYSLTMKVDFSDWCSLACWYWEIVW